MRVEMSLTRLFSYRQNPACIVLTHIKITNSSSPINIQILLIALGVCTVINNVLHIEQVRPKFKGT